MFCTSNPSVILQSCQTQVLQRSPVDEAEVCAAAIQLKQLDKSLSSLIDCLGLCVGDIKSMWNKNKIEAANRGTYMHLTFELYLNRFQITHYTTEIEIFIRYLMTLNHLTAYRTEWMIFSEEAKLDSN